jgi:hypothetical protein
VLNGSLPRDQDAKLIVTSRPAALQQPCTRCSCNWRRDDGGQPRITVRPARELQLRVPVARRQVLREVAATQAPLVSKPLKHGFETGRIASGLRWFIDEKATGRTARRARFMIPGRYELTALICVLSCLAIMGGGVACTGGGASVANGGASGSVGHAAGVGGSSSSRGGATGSTGTGGTAGKADASAEGGGGRPSGSGGGTGAGGAVSTGSGGSTDGGVDTGAAPGTAFGSVLSIFKTRCVPCHSAGAFAVPKTSLYLTADVAYSSLVGVAADETCAGILVVPGSPSQSYLVQKLTEQTPCSGVQMPMAYEAPFMGLTSAQMATIESWIDAGAPP